MKLIIANLETDEVQKEIDINEILNICVFTGEKLNTIAGWYGTGFNNNEKYYMIQLKEGDKFCTYDIKDVFMYFD